MPSILPLALLLGYAVGLAGAFLLLPREVLASLSSLVTLTSVVVAAAAMLAFFLRLPAPHESDQTAGDAASVPASSDHVRADRVAPGAAHADTRGGIGIARPVALAESGVDGPRLFGPLGALAAISPGELRRALDEERIGAVLRPLARPTRPRGVFHEAVARLCAADGSAFQPGEYRQVAARMGLLGEVDRVFVRRCARHLRDAPDQGLGLVCRIDPDSLADPAFVAELEGLAEGHPDFSRRFVLAIDRAALSRPARGAIARLRNHGIRFGLVRLDTDRLDVGQLQQLGVAMVRLEGAPTADRVTLVGLEALLDAAGITLLVDRPEPPRLGAASPPVDTEFMAA